MTRHQCKGECCVVLPQVLLNSLRRLLAVVPQTEHTLSRWCGGPPGHRPNSPSAGPSSPRRDGSSMPGALTDDGPGQDCSLSLHVQCRCCLEQLPVTQC